jgi:outer membrane protein OmpA-like peptidoglycan-associated protein
MVALLIGSACVNNADTPDKDEQVASERQAAMETLRRAQVTLDRVRTQPNFSKLSNQARGILIVPRLYNVGLVAGGKGGRGVLFVQDMASGEWNGPVFYQVYSASVGVQIGVEVAEVAVLIMSDRMLESVLAGDFKLGTTAAQTPESPTIQARPSSDAYSFSMSQGAFAGISVEGIRMTAHRSRNRAYHGQDLTARELIDDRMSDEPIAVALRSRLRGQRFAEASSRQSEMTRVRGEADAAAEHARQLALKLADYEYRDSDRGIVLVLQDVLFDTGRTDVKPGASAKLRPVSELLKQFPNRRVVVEGHTDSVGSPSFNKDLSQKRANAVRALLIGLGNDPARLSVRGHGAELPVASNTTGEGRQLNRRVEIVIEKRS